MSWLKKYKLPEYQIIGTVPFAPMAAPAQNASNNQAFSLSQPEPTIHFTLNDPRKTRMTTGQKINPNVDLVSGEYLLNDIDTVLKMAKGMGLSVEDAYNLAAMDLQETGWGNKDGEVGHALHGKGDSVHERFINAYSEKMKEADRLKIKDPMLRLQVYNGMGVVTPKTEKDYHGFEMQKIYGVPIPQGGISMRKNPLYGKQIVDLRDNVLKKNPNFVNYINSIYKPAGKKDGGWLHKYQKGGNFPTPYSNEVIDEYQQDYNNFYAPPKQYGNDDGYDAYYHSIQGKAPFNTTIQNDLGPTWVFTSDNGTTENKQTSEFPKEWQRKIDKGRATKENFKYYPNYNVDRSIDNSDRVASYLQTQAVRKSPIPWLAQGGQPPVNPNGMYDGIRDWRIPGGNITMKGVPFPVLAKASNGMSAIMQPGGEYNFPGAQHVDEYPMYKFGGSELQNGGWLDNYIPKAQNGLSFEQITGIKPITSMTNASDVTGGRSIQEQQKQDAIAQKIQRRNNATAKRQFVGQGQASTPESEARRIQLNKQNTAGLPNVQRDQFGNTSRINPNMTYTGQPANFMGERQQKGYEHVMGALEAAGYATGAGELAGAGYKALKTGLGESMESGFLSKLRPKYYKSAADRTWPQRYGETYSNIMDEYTALGRMHEISPENVVKPYNLKWDKQGNALGYKMQKFRGQNLNDYINSGKQVSPEVSQSIRETVSKLHNAGLAHGDLFGNIMINKKGTKFKLIDPVGYEQQKLFSNFEQAAQEDLNILDELLGKQVSKSKVSNSIMRNPEGEIQFLDNDAYKDVLTTGKKNIINYLSDPRYGAVVEQNQQLANRLGLNQTLPIQREMGNIGLQDARVAKMNQPITVVDPRSLETKIIQGTNEGIQAQYSRNLGGSGFINIPRVFDKQTTLKNVQHEMLHHVYPNLGEGYPSFTPLEIKKAKSVFKNNAALREVEKQNNVPLWYLDDADELVPNSFDLADDLGIQKFQEYPGKESFKNMLDSYSGGKKFIKDALKLDNKRDYKRAWDMLSGVRLGVVPAVGAAAVLQQQKNGGWLDEYQDGGTEYIVKKGDTLGQIGKQFGMTPQQIADANDISDINFIKTNQKLNIPGAAVPQQPITGPADIPVAPAQFQNTTPSFTQRQPVEDSVNIKNNPELYSDLDPEISSIISNYTSPSVMDNIEDSEKRERAKKIVEIARQHIAMGKKGYFEVPPDVAAASLREGKEPAGCVGGACKIAQEAGAMPKIFWSNTAFTKAAPELGFPNKGYGLRGIQNLEPGDFLTYQTELAGYDENNNPKYIPRHTQIFLGINPQTKEYEFFDNHHKRLMTYSEETIRDSLKQAKNPYDYGAVIYKNNPFHPTANSYTDETVQQAADKELFVKEQMKKPSNYKYSIRADAKDYDDSTKGIMNTFVNYANDEKNITDLVSKLKVGKDEIHDSLLNVFGELGQENNWSNSGKGLKSKAENVAEKLLTFFGGAKKYSVGPGQNKFSTIPEDLREQFDIKSPKDLYDINKVIPLMVAEDIRNKEVLRRWGQQNVLSHKLIGHTDKENPLRADDLKGGVGRWSPYLRNEFGLISSGKRIINNNDLIPWNGEDVTLDNWYNPGAGKLVSNYDMNTGMFMNPRTLAEGSYPDKVFHKTEDNLQRTLIIPNTETSPSTLPTQYVFSKAKPKKAFGGEIGWLNNYK